MKRYVVVSELYYPEQNATGHFLTGIAESLVGGSSMSLLCVHSRRIISEVPERQRKSSETAF